MKNHRATVDPGLHRQFSFDILRRRRTNKLLLLFLMYAGICNAQPKLTLEQAIDLALQRNLDLQIFRNNAEARTIANHIGMAGGLPTVSGSANITEQYNTIKQDRASGEQTQVDWARGNNVNASVTASQVLFNGMRVQATKHRLEELQKLSEQELNSLIQNTIARVTLQYFDIVRQQSYSHTLDRSLEAAQKRLEVVRARQSAGLANKVDLYQTEIDVNNFLQQHKQQELQVEQAKADFLRLLNLPSDSVIAIADTIVVDPALLLERISEAALKNPDLLAAEQQVIIFEWIEKETAAQRYPTLALNSGFNFSRTQTPAGFALMNQSYGPAVGLGLTVPIFNGGIFKRQQKIAAIDTKNARLRRENVLQDIQNTVTKFYMAYRNNLNQLETERKNYDLAFQLLDLITQRFELGHATIIEIKDAQTSFISAGFRVVNLSYAAKVAETELKRVSNRLGL